MNSVHFSSASTEWPTPAPLFDTLDAEFHFTLDPCATIENAKCGRYFDITDDGLAQPWDGVVFCNPPYGRQTAAWVRKAYEESRLGTLVVLLIPARTETTYWHDFVMRSAEVRLIRGRLHFPGVSRSGHNAPFPSAVVVFRPNHDGPPAFSTMVRP